MAKATVLASLLLAGCGGNSDDRLNVAVIGEPADLFAGGVRLAFAGQLAVAATCEGLVAFDEQGRVIPALADRWIVTDDGQSYIFRLRDGTWRNGDELTARSARQSLDAALEALRNTPLGSDLGAIDEVRAMAGRVIEIRLQRPMPNLLQLLAQPELGLRHDGEGGGPMSLARSGDAAMFTPIPPKQRGLPGIAGWQDRTRTIAMAAMPGGAAVARFNAGEADLVLGGRIEDFPRTRSVGILRGTIQLDPVDGLFGLQVSAQDGFLSVPENREALAMAIDRTALVAPFGVGGWRPTTRLVSPAVEGDLAGEGERWDALSQEDRRRTAADRVARWRHASAGDSAERVQLTIRLPPGPGSDILFRQLANDLAPIGIALARSSAQDADLQLIDEVARYPRASWYLNRFACRLRRGLCSPEADAALAEADSSADPAARAALLQQAEASLTAANVFIPFGPPVRWSLVRGTVSGFATNAWGWHPLMPLAWLPK